MLGALPAVLAAAILLAVVLECALAHIRSRP